MLTKYFSCLTKFLTLHGKKLSSKAKPFFTNIPLNQILNLQLNFRTKLVAIAPPVLYMHTVNFFCLVCYGSLLTVL